MTCSDSGLTPSSSAACWTRSRTAAASWRDSWPLTRTSSLLGTALSMLGVALSLPGAAPSVPGAELSVPGLSLRMRRCLPGGGGAIGTAAVCVRSAVWIGRAIRFARPAGTGRGSLHRHEPVSDVPHGADQRLILRAQLGPQPPDVHVDGPGAAEVVVAPDLLKQLRPGEYPARMLRQELQQLELLECEVQRPAVYPSRVGRLVDNQPAGRDLVGLLGRRLRPASDREPQPGFDLAGAGGVQKQVIGSPVGGDRCPAAVGDDRDHRSGAR